MAEEIASDSNVNQEIEEHNPYFFDRVVVVTLLDGIPKAILDIITTKLKQRGGKIFTTIGATTTHVVAKKWSTVFEVVCDADKSKMVNIKWLCACLFVGHRVPEEDFDLWLLDDFERSAPPPVEKKKKKQKPISVLVPNLVMMEQVIKRYRTDP